MEPSELTFFTTQELIAELMRRRTFFGVVVHSEQELKQQEHWGEERTFKVHFNGNLDPAKASRLLDSVSEYMDLHL